MLPSRGNAPGLVRRGDDAALGGRAAALGGAAALGDRAEALEGAAALRGLDGLSPPICAPVSVCYIARPLPVNVISCAALVQLGQTSMASDPPHEVVEAWALVEPPNILHDVVGRRALDDLGRRHGLDIGNLHQLCSITGGPAQKPIESVKPGWMLLRGYSPVLRLF